MFDSPELKTLSRYVRTYLGGLKTLCVEVDKQEWKYLEGGSGETIVFLHGALGSKTQWRSMMQEYLQDYRVIAIDVPGLYAGQTFRFKKHSYRQYGVWLSKVLDQLRLPRVHLVGVSLGGAVAAYFAAQFPGRVASLGILGFPSEIVSGGPDTRIALQHVIEQGRVDSVDDLQQLYNLSFFKAPSVPRIVLRYNLREFNKYREATKGVLAELAESRPVLVAGLRKIQVPTLIAHGTEDRLVAALDRESWLRQIPHASHHLLTECGHMIHIEKPEEMACLHKEMLRSIRQLPKPQSVPEEDTGRFVRLE